MESMTIPILSLVAGVILWCAWLTVKVFQGEKDIAINTSNDITVGKQIDDVKKDMERRIDKFESHVNTKFDKVFEKIDQITR